MICLNNVELSRTSEQQRGLEARDTDSSDDESSQIDLVTDADDSQILLPCNHSSHRKCIF
jgi:hypothetical protein